MGLNEVEGLKCGVIAIAPTGGELCVVVDEVDDDDVCGPILLPLGISNILQCYNSPITWLLLVNGGFPLWGPSPEGGKPGGGLDSIQGGGKGTPGLSGSVKGLELGNEVVGSEWTLTSDGGGASCVWFNGIIGGCCCCCCWPEVVGAGSLKLSN